VPTVPAKILRHQVYTQRYSSSVLKEIMILLNKADVNLAARLQERLRREQDNGIVSTARLNAILADIRAMNAQVYESMNKELSTKLQNFATYESQFQVSLVNTGLVGGASMTMPPMDLVKSLATDDPIRGRLLSEWTSAMSDAKYARVRDAVRIGLVEGQTTDEIVRAIRGTASNGYADGIIEIDRRNAAALVRTAVNSVANSVKDTVFEENDDIIEGVQWTSTLDDATCLECGELDGEEFDLKDGPRPPAHVNCRCTIVPVISKQYDLLGPGKRPAVGDDGAEQVSANLTYGDWLGTQSAAFQDDALGPTRGALFRRGDLTIDKFTNRAGDQLTLDQLREKQPAAFARANL
jgi:SPP1 gp7 family putative phage head morphogenesis protein